MYYDDPLRQASWSHVWLAFKDFEIYMHQRSDPHVSYILVLSFPSFLPLLLVKPFVSSPLLFLAPSTIFGAILGIWFGSFGHSSYSFWASGGDLLYFIQFLLYIFRFFPICYCERFVPCWKWLLNNHTISLLDMFKKSTCLCNMKYVLHDDDWCPSFFLDLDRPWSRFFQIQDWVAYLSFQRSGWSIKSQNVKDIWRSFFNNQ